MEITSNIDALDADIRALIESMNFEHSVGNMSLGKRMAEKTAEAINTRSIYFKKGASAQWDANKEPYRSWKAEKYSVHDQPGVRTGQMLSHESLVGRTHVSDTEVEMVYGTDETPTRSSGSDHFDDRTDGAVTDRQKAGWFTDGGPNQSPRPFYELDEDIADQVFDVVAETVKKILRDAT